MGETGYIYFEIKEMEFIKNTYPKLFRYLKQFISNENDEEIELELTEEQLQEIHMKMFDIISEDAGAHKDGNPSMNAIKLEKIWIG
ncbi:hypothetical protein GTO87_05655 [Ligilactobacillus saerimneri]|uniref:Uncharacterized protein n=1 Tax=Ligilactobacillus saerimneri TaxID=228229 RepID=A0A7H9EKQ0_9LACO|nr:hypothetical protein [Ligilactobacillus saerimneri]QLL78131.1 hypothetical protein GTO87_05655 [Ligilactobacillus saerimneri]